MGRDPWEKVEELHASTAGEVRCPKCGSWLSISPDPTTEFVVTLIVKSAVIVIVVGWLSWMAGKALDMRKWQYISKCDAKVALRVLESERLMVRNKESMQ